MLMIRIVDVVVPVSLDKAHAIFFNEDMDTPEVISRRRFIKAAAIGLTMPSAVAALCGCSAPTRSNMASSAKNVAANAPRKNPLPTGGLVPEFESSAKMAQVIGNEDMDSAKEAGPPSDNADSSAAPEVASGNQAQNNAAEGDLFSGDGAWNLVLVNRWNYLPEGHVPNLAVVTGSYKLDERCVSAAKQMLADCRAAGNIPVVCSAFRSESQQASLFESSVQKKMAQGYSKEMAIDATQLSIAIPRTSEHQLGLALDIVDASNKNLNGTQEGTATSRWLHDNCWQYGFIVRYPSDKTDITGIIYEPWHYRYVGIEASSSLRQSGLCLEEYLGA